jgi:hypothetical protein
MRQGRPPRPLHQQITDPAVEAVLVSVGILPWDNPDGPNQTVSLLLTSREHKAVNRNYFNAKIWKPALVAAGVPPTRENGCHALRHFYASVLLDGGESIKTVSHRLGHADPAFTLRTYTHLMPDSRSAPGRSSTLHSDAIRPQRSLARVPRKCHDSPDDVHLRSSAPSISHTYGV